MCVTAGSRLSAQRSVGECTSCSKSTARTPPGPQVLRLVIGMYERLESPDQLQICQCLMFLGDDAEVATLLHRLLAGSEASAPRCAVLRCVVLCNMALRCPAVFCSALR